MINWNSGRGGKCSLEAIHSNTISTEVNSLGVNTLVFLFAMLPASSFVAVFILALEMIRGRWQAKETRQQEERAATIRRKAMVEDFRTRLREELSVVDERAQADLLIGDVVAMAMDEKRQS